MTPLRVAYVVNVFPKLSETFIAHELAELRRRGVELCVLSLRRPNETLRHELIAEHGLDRLTSHVPAEFETRLRHFRPHLLHAHFATEPAAAARELAAQLGVPFTFTAHGYDIHRKPPPDFAQRAAAARRVITVSQANARHITSAFGVPHTHISVIPCGVDTRRFQPAPEPHPPSSPPLLVCVARLVAVKNHRLLLHACAALRDRNAEFRCALVGDGPLRNDLETLRGELNLDPIVEFAGAAEQRAVLQWWLKASIALLSSDNEGMPVCLMEAAACGVPAAATDAGGVPELVEHGVTGLLSPTGDPDALSRSLEYLLRNPDRAAAMGRAARQRAEQQLSLTRQVDALLDLWTGLLR